MFIHCLWFIEQAWETVFKPFPMKICEVIWIFTNDLWETGYWKRDISFFLLSLYQWWEVNVAGQDILYDKTVVPTYISAFMVGWRGTYTSPQEPERAIVGSIKSQTFTGLCGTWATVSAMPWAGYPLGSGAPLLNVYRGNMYESN